MGAQYDEIFAMIDELPLTKILPKILRFTQDLHDPEFEKWTRLELNGYWNTNPALTDNTIVPIYRTVTGYYTDDFGRVFSVSDPELAFVNETRLRFGVLEIEGFLGAKGPLSIRELGTLDLINKTFKIQVTTFHFYPNQLSNILSAIKTELSDRIMSHKNQLETHPLQSKKSDTEDIIELKPNFYGIGVNFRALFRKIQSKGK